MQSTSRFTDSTYYYSGYGLLGRYVYKKYWVKSWAWSRKVSFEFPLEDCIRSRDATHGNELICCDEVSTLTFTAFQVVLPEKAQDYKGEQERKTRQGQSIPNSIIMLSWVGGKVTYTYHYRYNSCDLPTFNFEYLTWKLNNWKLN